MNYSLAAGISMSALLLFACNHSDPTPSPSAIQDGTGSARIQLPAAPRAFLAQATTGTELVFALEITGEQQDPIRTSWPLMVDGEQTVTLAGIPAGIHSFTGSILEIDGSTRDTLVTHRGGDSAHIVAGRTTQIRLYMGRVRDGGAQICLAVEGWDPDPDCLPVSSEVVGCWSIAIMGSDTLRESISARLRLEIVDSNVTAYLGWSQGVEDTAYGTYTYGTLYIGGDNQQPFRLKGVVSGGILRADVSSPRLLGNGYIRGIRGDCNAIQAPFIPDYSGCWKVVLRNDANDTMDIGGLRIQQSESRLTAILSLASRSPQSADGYVNEGGTALLGQKNGPFTFKGVLDKNGHLTGALGNSIGDLNGTLDGIQTTCSGDSSSK